MAGIPILQRLPLGAKNLLVAVGCTGVVFGTYFYTMHAVKGSDEIQTAIDTVEKERNQLDVVPTQVQTPSS